MFKKKLELIFVSMMLIAVAVLLNNYYNTQSFKNNELPLEYQQRIEAKEREVLYNMQKNYGFAMNIPMIVTDKFKGRLYGLTSYQDGKITIYLNKKVMQESMDYMVESVIAHEYAHALMFYQGHIKESSDGHSKQWQRTCVRLGGKDCQQYVDQKEIVMSKMPF